MLQASKHYTPQRVPREESTAQLDRFMHCIKRAWSDSSHRTNKTEGRINMSSSILEPGAQWRPTSSGNRIRVEATYKPQLAKRQEQPSCCKL